MSTLNSIIALSGGGTGGHIYPCLAVAELIKEQNPGTKLFYIGNDNKLEAELLSKTDLKDSQNQPFSSYIKFLAIRSYPLVNKVNPLSFFLWLYRFYCAKEQAVKHLRENKIQIVFGTGGYVAAPVFAAAIKLKIPYIMHNLDAHIGLANKMFIADAQVLTSAFDLKVKPRNGNFVITGNPIAKKFLINLNENKSNDGTSFNLLITGGSQGAEAVNNAIGEILPELVKIPGINIVHVTGTKPYADYVSKYLNDNPTLYSNYKVLAYTHEMPQLCSWATVSVCRSGAMTIAEICASKVVPVFVPLPWAAHDHQNLNAKALVDGNAAISLNQNDKDFKTQLLNTIQELTTNRNKLNAMKEKLASFAKPQATKELAEIILQASK